MEIRLLTDWEEVASHAEDWNRLAGHNPFRSWAWLDSWWSSYGALPGRRPFVLMALDGQQLVGLGPWFQETSKAQGNVIRWLGSGEVCTDYIGISAATGRAEDVAARFADWFASNNTASWDLLHLDSIDRQDQITTDFVNALESHGCTTDRRAGFNCWRIELPGSWDELLSRMSKSHRKQLRRVERRLLDTGLAKLHTVSDRRDLVEAMPILVDLHQRRRATLGQPGCFASDAFHEFLHQAAFELLEAELLKLYWVSLEGRPVAAEFQISDGGVTYCYQAGVDPDAIESEPGRLIMIATIREAIDKGQSAIDFLRGDEPYKAHWRAEVRPTTEVRIASRAALARIRHHLWKTGDTIKHWLKTKIGKQQPTHHSPE